MRGPEAGYRAAVSQLLIDWPTGRALPKKFFGIYLCKIAFVVRDFKDEFVDLYTITVHRAKW
ncbi:MAG: hypothetical protein WAN55_09380 [Halobacteriota archaeon]